MRTATVNQKWLLILFRYGHHCKAYLYANLAKQVKPLIHSTLRRFPFVRTGRPDHCRTSQLANKNHLLFLELFLKNHLLRVYYLGFDWTGWIVLIKSEILFSTGMVWRVKSDKWKAPLEMHVVYNQQRDLGPDETYQFLFKNGDFFLRFGLSSTLIRWKRTPRTHFFKNAFQNGVFLKTPAYRLLVDGRKRRFRIRCCHTPYTRSIPHAL